MASSAVVEEARTIEKYSPVTGEKIAEYPIASVDEVKAAVEAASQAFGAWRDLSISARFKYINRLRDVIREDGEYYAARISEDTGKPLSDSLLTELMVTALMIDHYEKTAEKVLSRKRVRNPLVFPFKKSYVEHFAMGVVAVISPWNFPFQLAVVPAISALIAGNTVIVKPSEVTPIVGEIIAEVFEKAGFPKGVFQLLQGDGTTGAALCDSDVQKIFFTGSVATGRRVMQAASKRLIPVELELGGKDPFIVCHDAPLERAAKACAWGGLVNCGQMCTSVERVFVVESVYDKFMALLKNEVSQVKAGGPDEDADIGPMTFPKQIKIVEAHIADAKAKGAKITLGGNRIDRDGQFFEPTLIEDVTTEMDVYVEETFGPVIPVIKVKDEEEAIRLSNAHQYGLNASVWTLDVNRGIEIASRLECGQVTVNEIVQSVGNPVLPFGGVKNSGFGRYHGDEGLLSFTHTRAIMADYGRLSTEPFWFPYAGKYPEMLKAFKALLDGKLPKALISLVKIR
jgi:acyl-CoA reductase-like NAD-dependent aldehyde dehydrogenase